MTIAISLKVNDGVVLATDSASTIFARPSGADPGGVINVYQNAEKLFNICKGKPIGAITWGSGSIGSSSISTLMKDFRKAHIELTGESENKQIDIKSMTEELANFIYNEKYIPAYTTWPEPHKPVVGFVIAGYSGQNSFAEEWKFEIIGGQLIGPTEIRAKEESGIIWNGEPEAISRLILGYSQKLPLVLRDCGIDESTVNKIIGFANTNIAVPMVIAPMPIKDVIDLAEFLAETTINFSKFSPGAPTVGGPIDIAAITKHEGFKWVKRKYYYNRDVNPS